MGDSRLPQLPEPARGRTDALSVLQIGVATHQGSMSRENLQNIPTPFPMKSVKHKKEAGSSYLEGSPLYAREQQRVDAPLSAQPPAPLSAPPAQPLAAPPRLEPSQAAPLPEQQPIFTYGLPLSSPMRRFMMLLLAHVMFALVVVMWAYLYRAHGKSNYLRDVQAFNGDSFTFGLFDVGNMQQDWSICLLACCCPAVRWADTMTKARLLPFWTALGLMIVMILLGPVTYGAIFMLIVLVAVYFRQRLRKLYNHGPFKARALALDCLTWCFCSPCAVAQEAREVEKVQRVVGPPLQQHVQLPRGTASPAAPAAAPQQKLQDSASASSLRLTGTKPAAERRAD